MERHLRVLFCFTQLQGTCNVVTHFKKASALLAIITICISFSTSALAENFAGSWILEDTGGKPFEAVLGEDGKASGTHGDSMKHGTWKEEDGAAVIHWDTGWTTRISKHGEHFIKEAFKPGGSLSDKPTNTSDAKRKQ
jgi:hypothetical protein